jgi:hypothetical protein
MIKKQITYPILSSVKKLGRGWVFTARNFVKIGSRNSVDKILSRLAARNDIRSLGWGIYDYPIYDLEKGCLPPEPLAVAKALAVQSSSKLQFAGAQSCLLLEVPHPQDKRNIYLTSGRTKKFSISGIDIYFKHTVIPPARSLYDKANLAVQAMIYLGSNLSKQTTSNIIGKLDGKEKRRLKRLMNDCPKNIIEIMHKSALL